MKKLIPHFFLGLLISWCFFKKLGAQPYTYDFLTQPISQEDGDTIATSQVNVSTNAATLISSSEPVTSQGANGFQNRSYRKRVIFNGSAYSIYIGTNSTSLTSNGFLLTNSTFSSTTSLYQTYNKAAIYGQCAASAVVANCLATVILETNSIP